MSAEEKMNQLELAAGYHFQDAALLRRALSHSSYYNEHRSETDGDNERLEFLGDAVLEMISSVFLYSAYPHLPEGDLTKLRASIVCEPTLAMCAREFSFQNYLLLGKGEEMNGGRQRDSIVSDALEALIGAIYLDGGIEQARAFVTKFILNDIEHKKLFYDSKTILQEVVQRELHVDEVTYRLLDQAGPDHDKRYTSAVYINDTKLGEGCSSSKKHAEQEAAYRALIELKQRGIHVS